MDNILSKLFQKRGIKDATELDQEERQQFDEWQLVLNKPDATIEDVVKFCDGAITSIEAQFGDLDVPDEKKVKLTLQHAIYSNIKNIINAPTAEKENLIKYLTELLK